MKKKLKKIIWFVSGSLGLLLVSFAIYVIIVLNTLCNNPFNDLNFERQVWISNNDINNSDNPRGKMIDDLKSNYLKTGMPKQNIIKLLGEPDFKIENSRIIGYYIGCWTGFRIDVDTFDIKLDSKDKLVSASVVQH